VFGVVYTQRFPDAAPGLFKYCDVVNDIAMVEDDDRRFYKLSAYVNVLNDYWSA